MSKTHNTAQHTNTPQKSLVKKPFIAFLYSNVKKLFQWPSSKLYLTLVNRLSMTWNFAIKFLAILTSLLVLKSSVEGIFQESYRILPFKVPATYSEIGIDGHYVIWQLNDNITEIQQSGWSVSGLTINTKPENTVDQDIELFGISFNSVKSLIRHGLGLSNKSISGTLLIQNDKLLLKIAVSGNESFIIKKDVNEYNDQFEAYNALLTEAALDLLNVIDPFVLASYFWNEKQPDMSLKIIQNMIKRNAHSLDSAYLIWGKILEEQGDSIAAANKFELSVELNPDQHLAWAAWCTILYRNTEYELAIKKCQKALSIEQEFWEARYILAKAQAKKNMHKKSIHNFLAAIDINPKRYSAFNELSYEFQALNNLSGAIEILQKGIFHNPHVGVLHATLAEMYWTNNQHKQAFNSLTEARKLGFDIHPYINSEPYSSFNTKFSQHAEPTPQ